MSRPDPNPFDSVEFEYWTDGSAIQVVETWIKLRIKALESKRGLTKPEALILEVLRFELSNL